jgi:beta-lactamase class A
MSGDQHGVDGAPLEDRLTGLFDDAGVDGFVHVRDIDGTAARGHRERQPVLLASCRKVALLMELARAMDTGEWSPTERIRLRPPPTPVVGYGIAQLRDEVEISLRDLATQMVSVSVNRMLKAIGVREFVFRHPTYDAAAHDQTEPFGLPALGARATAESASRLLAKIWRDEAGTPAACAEVRRILATQVFTHRLRSGFPDQVRTAGKTGSWKGWKNEIGVAEFPDRRRYAVAVFTRLRRPPEQTRLTAQDVVIGSAAAAAVASLRGEE